ncbi:MAG: carboxypeptidase-like regulatory domain-containing protein [Candidatus Omnitrophica bacterium]|nr:carboxypeptidase-like regulatory domain-containing protein [Candidatus Omnitrophota bacterium]
MKMYHYFPSFLTAVWTLGALAESVEPPTFRLAGKVVDSDGRPVAAALAKRYERSADAPFGPGEMEEKQRLTTGANGTFEFAVPSHSLTFLVASKPGRAPAWNQYWNLSADKTNECLVMTPPSTLAGVVVDEANKPVPSATVWISSAYSEGILEDNGTRTFHYLSDKPARDLFSARTGADGRFRIKGFPTNATADLVVSAPGKAMRRPEREYTGPDTMLCVAGQQDIKLVVEPAGTIEGRIALEPTGQPIAGARFLLEPSDPRTRAGARLEPVLSGSDGSFRITNILAGSYRLRALDTNAPANWIAEPVTVDVESAQTTRDILVKATKGGLLRVSVFDKIDRKPVAKAGVSAARKDYYSVGSTESNGVVVLRLPPGEFHVSAYRESSRAEPVSATVELGKTNLLEIELSPPPKIKGVVRDPSGSPAPGVAMSVFGGFGPNQVAAKTDADGRFEMVWNPERYGQPGAAFCVVARDMEKNLAVVQDIDEGTTNVDLRLEPGLQVLGRAEDIQGRPITNATGSVGMWSGNMGSQFGDPFKADAQGRFEITGLPQGRRYYVFVSAKGYGSESRNMASDDTETNRIDLPAFVLKVADRQLAGQVLDADEKPVAGAGVSIQGEGQPYNSARTDSNGRFRFAAVCEGPVRLYASYQRSFGSVQVEGGDTNVMITLGVNQAFTRESPRRPSLKGRPLPDLADVGLSADAVPADHPVLLCLFDHEQRPSRHCMQLLIKQHDSLREKGVAVAAVQAAITTAESLKAWTDENPLPYPVGRVPDKSTKTQWASGVESLPWLILAGRDRRVVAEGFTLDELEANLKSLNLQKPGN